MRTSAFGAQRALYDLIVADPALVGVVCYYGGVVGQVPEEFISISGEVENGSQQYEASGLVAKSETYDLRVEIFTQFATVDYVLVQERLRDLSTPIERIIHDNPTLNGTVMLASVGRFRMEEAVYEGMRQGLLTVWVTVDSWLSGS